MTLGTALKVPLGLGWFQTQDKQFRLAENTILNLFRLNSKKKKKTSNLIRVKTEPKLKLYSERSGFYTPIHNFFKIYYTLCYQTNVNMFYKIKM